MTIEISKENRAQAVLSIERYFVENREEKISIIAAEGLLNYFLAEIGPLVYNKAVVDVQERLQVRVMEVDMEIHEDEFQFWRQAQKGVPPRR
jgi:uncharacterized protein (DUF2164 family)